MTGEPRTITVSLDLPYHQFEIPQPKNWEQLRTEFNRHSFLELDSYLLWSLEGKSITEYTERNFKYEEINGKLKERASHALKESQVLKEIQELKGKNCGKLLPLDIFTCITEELMIAGDVLRTKNSMLMVEFTDKRQLVVDLPVSKLKGASSLAEAISAQGVVATADEFAIGLVWDEPPNYPIIFDVFTKLLGSSQFPNSPTAIGVRSLILSKSIIAIAVVPGEKSGEVNVCWENGKFVMKFNELVRFATMWEMKPDVLFVRRADAGLRLLEESERKMIKNLAEAMQNAELLLEIPYADKENEKKENASEERKEQEEKAASFQPGISDIILPEDEEEKGVAKHPEKLLKKDTEEPAEILYVGKDEDSQKVEDEQFSKMKERVERKKPEEVRRKLPEEQKEEFTSIQEDDSFKITPPKPSMRSEVTEDYRGSSFCESCGQRTTGREKKCVICRASEGKPRFDQRALSSKDREPAKSTAEEDRSSGTEKARISVEKNLICSCGRKMNAALSYCYFCKRPKKVEAEVLKTPEKENLWECSRCLAKNVESNTRCDQCNNRKSTQKTSPEAESPSTDWTCAKCQTLNSSYRSYCKKCITDRSTAPKEVQLGYEKKQSPTIAMTPEKKGGSLSVASTQSAEKLTGRWTCTCGTSNYNSSEKCYRCYLPKSPEKGQGVEEVKKGINGQRAAKCIKCSNATTPGESLCQTCKAPAVNSEASVWKCTYCSTLNTGSNSLCSKCRKVRQASAEIRDEQLWKCVCGAENFEDDQRCYSCIAQRTITPSTPPNKVKRCSKCNTIVTATEDPQSGLLLCIVCKPKPSPASPQKKEIYALWSCVYCSNDNLLSAEACFKCGAKRGLKARVKQCPGCSALIPESEIKCAACRVKREKRCGDCGAQIPEMEKLCTRCKSKKQKKWSCKRCNAVNSNTDKCTNCYSRIS